MSDAVSAQKNRIDEAVEYALSLTQGYLENFKKRCINLDGLRLLEIGPGKDFAPQLVLASCGAQVTVADKYLSAWDPEYHPDFYAQFLQRWNGPSAAVKSVLQAGSYSGTIRTICEPVERLRSLETGFFDYVQSNAVLEHVVSTRKAVSELARITKPGGIQAHQVDFRDHRNFDRPLDVLLLNRPSYRRLRRSTGGENGTAMRMPELIEQFTRYFWVWDVRISCAAEHRYVDEIRQRLPPESPYRRWPTEALRQTSGCIWLARKDSLIRHSNIEEPGAFAVISSKMKTARSRLRTLFRA